MFADLVQDLRGGLRMFIKSPAFTITAILALALGIGANSAIFSVIDAVLIRPLRFVDPDRLVLIWATNPRLQLGVDEVSASVADYLDWRAQSTSFDGVAAFWPGTYSLTGAGAPESLDAMQVSPDLFSLLGVGPELGRAFLPEEEQYGRHRVVIVSHGLWRRLFGADSSLQGKTLTLDGESFTVVGVMPPEFHFALRPDLPVQFRFFPLRTELWTPMAFPPERVSDRATHNIGVIARLKTTVPLAQASSEMRTIAKRLEEQHPRTNKGFTTLLAPLHEQAVGRVKTILLICLGAVAFVLLIACANVANLLLARAASRQKEIAIRMALGAGRMRLVRQFLTESALLALMSGVLGLLLALWGVDVLLAFAPHDLPRMSEVGVDGRVLGFTLLISLLTALIFGIVPAHQTSRPDLNESLREGARGSASALALGRVRGLLVVSEIALSLVLLIGAGLMIKSFLQLQQVDPGFDPRRVLTMEIALPPSGYAEGAPQSAFFDQLQERLANLPGVEAASASTSLPFTGSENSTGITFEGRAAAEQVSLADYAMIGPDFFHAMGITISKGRDFSTRDRKDAPQVAIISEALARRFFPGEDPIGKRLSVSLERGVPREIVGVVGDVKYSSLNAAAISAVYLPRSQFPSGFMYVVVRATSDPRILAGGVRREVWAIDKDLPVSNMSTMSELTSASIASQRFNMVIVGVFSGVALILAAVGIYGVMSYTVTQRTHEIGVRMAVGARSRDVLRLVVGQCLRLTVVGVGAGLAASFVLTRVMESLLFGVSATDPVTFALIPLVLTGAALMACFVPARRATRVDPLIALRYE